MTDEERFFYNHGYKQAERDFIKELEKIKTEIGAKVFEIQPTSDKYFGGVDDVMDIVSSIIDKHIKELNNEEV